MGTVRATDAVLNQGTTATLAMIDTEALKKKGGGTRAKGHAKMLEPDGVYNGRC